MMSPFGSLVCLCRALPGGSPRESFDTVLDHQVRKFRQALDPQLRPLPGFGSSGKPARAPYTARWYAETMLAFMDAQDISHAHLVGNSMGGRIAIEMGLMEPERIRSLGLLCPAVAWVKRGFHPLVRLLRPEFGLLPHGFTGMRSPPNSGACSTTGT